MDAFIEMVLSDYLINFEVQQESEK